MARINGSCYGGNNPGKYSLWIDWSESNVENANNRSKITVVMKLQRNDGYAGSAWKSSGCPVKLTVDGAVRVNASIGIDTRNSKIVTLASWSGYIGHNADGSKSVAISGSFSISGVSSVSGGNVSGNAALTNIPRASVPTLSKNTFNIGETVTIYTNRKASSYTHKVEYACAGQTVTIATGVAGSYAWNTSVLRQYTGSATSRVGNVFVTTYNGSTQIGSRSFVNFTANVPADWKPAVQNVTATIVNDNATVSGWGIALQSFSKVRVTAGVTPSSPSPITSYKLTGGGQTVSGTSATLTTAAIQQANNVQFTYTVTDGRGRVASGTSNAISFVPYSKPAISNVQCYRCDAEGHPANSGTYVYVGAVGNYASCGGRNQLQLEVHTRQEKQTAFSKAADLQSGVGLVMEGFAKTMSYAVKIVAVDSLGSRTDSPEWAIATERVGLNFCHTDQGEGAAFFDYADEPGVLHVNGKLRISEQPVADFIVEQGTDGIWTYRKWSSGVAECWGMHTIYNLNLTNFSANSYYATQRINFPLGLFIDGSAISANVNSGLNAAFAYNGISGVPHAGYVDVIFVGHTQMENITAWCNIRATGKWK